MRLMEMAAVAALAVVAAAPATAQVERAASQPPTILSITGEGVSEAPPDMAQVRLGVANTALTAQAASQENARLMQELVQALRRAGVAERDIQTAGLRVEPVWDLNRRDERVIANYLASNTVTAEVRQVQNTGRVIDAAVAVGGNTVEGLVFTHQNPATQRDAARRSAVADARHRADLYAEAFGLRVVRVVTVTEGGARFPEEIVVTGSRLAVGAHTPAPTPVAAGEIETRATVSVTFELRT
jgi:uncharacterized protein YggE